MFEWMHLLLAGITVAISLITYLCGKASAKSEAEKKDVAKIASIDTKVDSIITCTARMEATVKDLRNEVKQEIKDVRDELRRVENRADEKIKLIFDAHIRQSHIPRVAGSGIKNESS